MAVEAEEDGDPAAEALDGVAAVASEVATEQRRVAGIARTMARRHRHGASLRQLVDDDAGQRLVVLLRDSAALLVGIAGRLQRVLVKGLSAEGLSTRQIGSHFGVSHQRISSLLSRRDD